MQYGIQKFTLKFTLNIIREGVNICDRDNWLSQKKCFKDIVLLTSFWICRKYVLIKRISVLYDEHSAVYKLFNFYCTLSNKPIVPYVTGSSRPFFKGIVTDFEVEKH